MARKPKSNGTDDETPGPGHNSGPSGQVYAECYAEYASLVEERTRINWDIAALFERFEDRGVGPKEKKAIKAAYSTAHNKDQTEAKDQHRTNTAVMLAIGLLTLADADWTKKAKQAEIFPDATATGEIVYRRAYSEGRKASATHALVKSLNPHVPGTRAFEGWNDGWEIGASDRAGAGMDAPDRTERKAPGRPRAAAVTPEPETRDPAEPPAATMDEAMARSRAHLGGDLPEPPAVIN